METVRQLHTEQGEAGPEQSPASEADTEAEDQVLERPHQEAGLCWAPA